MCNRNLRFRYALVLGHNGRTLELPIDISYIKKYCLTSNIKPNEIYDALIWIIDLIYANCCFIELTTEEWDELIR